MRYPPTQTFLGLSRVTSLRTSAWEATFACDILVNKKHVFSNYLPKNLIINLNMGASYPFHGG